MFRSLAARALTALGLACAGACLVEPPDFTGKACAPPAHPCLDGYACVQGSCLRAPLVSVSSAAPAVLAGACATGEVSLRLQDGGPAVLDTPMDVGMEVDGGMRLFTDLSCRQQAAVVTVPRGASDASFSFFALRGGRYQIAASGQANRAVLDQDVSPLVRTGRCALADGQTQVSCPVVPPVLETGRSFLVFQSSSTEPHPGDAGVRCWLDAAGAVSCDRDGAAGQVYVQWQVAEVPGARVQTVTTSSACFLGQYVMPLPSPAGLQGAFALFSERHFGVTFGSDDFSLVRLFDPATALVENVAGCSNLPQLALQVVELPGAAVQRGVTGPMDAGFSSVDDLLPAAVNPARSLLLHTHLFAGGVGSSACAKVVRGEVTGSGALVRFTRGFDPGVPPACVAPGSEVPAIAWEEIQVPPGDRLQRLVLDMASGVADRLLPITAVDPTRTLVLASGQGSAGQAYGETREAVATDHAPAVIGLELRDGGSAIRATRSVPGEEARWTVYVWELGPTP